MVFSLGFSPWVPNENLFEWVADFSSKLLLIYQPEPDICLSVYMYVWNMYLFMHMHAACLSTWLRDINWRVHLFSVDVVNPTV